MAEEPKQAPEKKFADDVRKAAHMGKSAVKAAAKAGTGDVAGAVLEILKDEHFRKAIIAILLVFAFLTTACSMMVGTAIWGAVEHLCQTWAENWDENWEAQGVASNGSALYKYSKGLLKTVGGTAKETFQDLFSKNETHEVDGRDAANADLAGVSNPGYTDQDTQNTILSITEDGALLGADGALRKRLDMIKGRVEQRGKQILAAAETQYSLEALGNMAANQFKAYLETPDLYQGISEGSKVNVDLKAFELSDLQALKILAAYSIQYDCDPSSVDMWSLMDYLGWYDIGLEHLDADLSTDSIYNSVTSVTVGASNLSTVSVGADITDLLTEGSEDGSGKNISFSPLAVPVWRGTFEPQKYVETDAQIKAHNNQYWDKLEREKNQIAVQPENAGLTDDEITELAKARIPQKDQLWGIQEDRDSEIYGYEKFKSYGLIDRMYTVSQASMTIEAIHEDVDPTFREKAASFFGQVATDWAEAPDTNNYTDEFGSLFTPSAITWRGTTDYTNIPDDSTYSLVDNTTGKSLGAFQAQDGAVELPGLTPATSYTLYAGSIQENHKPGEHDTIICTLSTPENPWNGCSAYQLQVIINITFGSRDVDTLLRDVIGLWDGSLKNTVEKDGSLFCKGHAGNGLMDLSWEVPMRDSDGTEVIRTFNRMTGYQQDAYKDTVLGMAATMGVSTTGLYADTGAHYGETMAATALAEYEYYTQNGLVGGGRYWDGYAASGGIRYGDNTPWCAAFVYYCATQCGYVGDGELFGSSWVLAVNPLWAQFDEQKQNMTHYDAGYVPSVGDLILFGDYAPTDKRGSGLEHIGIVVKMDEDGTMWVVDGNNGNRCRLTAYRSYAIGSAGLGPTVIAGYISPDYPQTGNTDLLYQQASGTMKPLTMASTRSGLFLAGLGRVTEAQMPEVLAELQKRYPELWTEDLGKFETDRDAFLNAWNDLAAAKASAFGSAQLAISGRLYVQPVLTELRTTQKFDWGKTPFRQNILWAVCTMTDQTEAAEAVLTDLCLGQKNDVEDADLWAAIQGKLQTVPQNYESALWPNATTAQKAGWRTTWNSFLPLLQKAFFTKGETEQ